MTKAEEEERPELKDLESALEQGPVQLQAFLEEAHPADLAEWLLELEDGDVWRVFRALDTEQGVELLEYAEDPVREVILARISVDELVEHVEEMPADEVVDVLALTDDDVSEQVLRAVDFERAQELRKLATYGPETGPDMAIMRISG